MIDQSKQEKKKKQKKKQGERAMQRAEENIKGTMFNFSEKPKETLCLFGEGESMLV
jgi:hypothetical protein